MADENNWYVVEDDEGVWLLQNADEDDKILKGPMSQEDAEQALQREFSLRGE